MSPTFVTLAVPFPHHNAEAVEVRLDAIGNPMRADLRARLDALGTVHFCTVNVVPAPPGNGTAHLVCEITADGEANKAVRAWAAELSDVLAPALAAMEVDMNGEGVAEFMARPAYRVRAGTGWMSTPGLSFAGAPDMTVERITQEAEFAAAVTTHVVVTPTKRPALETLREVRAKMAGDPRFGAFLKKEEALLLEGQRSAIADVLPALIKSALGRVLAPLTVLICLGGIAAFSLGVVWSLEAGAGPLWAFAAGVAKLFWFLVASLLIVAAVVLVGYFRFRSRERADLSDDAAPDPRHLERIMRRENAFLPDSDRPELEAATVRAKEAEMRDPEARLQGTAVVQNHLFAVSTMKPGRMRRLTLRLSFWVIEAFATHIFRPGHLGPIGTIHSARWVLLPGTNQLLFFSNYGGSWESYLEDFITQAHAGLTGVWSNTVGFPRAKNLFMDGATDGDRFKRWARREQRPTLAWYSAYPHLTTGRIRKNAAIRQGLAVAATESEARDWLSCFNSAPLTAEKLEAEDIQALAFSGLPALRSSRALMIQMADDPESNQDWLAAIEPGITTAEKIPEDRACIIGLTADGLTRLGMSDAARKSFPVAFQHGMNAEWRARLLGDIDDDAPERWRWGGPEQPVHAMLALYGTSRDQVEDMVAEQKRLAASHGLSVTLVIEMRERSRAGKSGAKGVSAAKGKPGNRPAGHPFEAEPFGFADGVSQPIIRGTPRALKHREETDHIVEAGEIILGYADNRRALPPSPIVPADEDELSVLPARATDLRRQRPNFAMSEARAPRDLGRNGSFLVVRQLCQHVDAFETYLREAARELDASPQRQWIDLPKGATLEEWIGAKIVGRWRDGSSMARHAGGATSLTNGRVSADNRFRFGEDDPAGFGCPLGSHIRRANPRDSFAPGSAEQLSIVNRHRILRAGRVYQDRANEETGLLFMCLNADIERQFEFIQQSWCMATQFHGLDNEADPILGRGLKSTRVTIPTPYGPISIKSLPKFISVRGGGYFFMPSRRALKWLAAIGKPASKQTSHIPVTASPETLSTANGRG